MNKFIANLCTAAGLALIAGSVSAQMVTGSGMPGYAETLGLATKEHPQPDRYTVTYYETNVPGNVLWPGEQGKYSFQLRNKTKNPIKVKGKVVVIQYGTKGQPGDIWVPLMVKIADVISVPIEVDIAPEKWQNITVAPKLPETFGAYAFVVDLGPNGRQFGMTVARTFKANPERVLYPKLGCDVSRPDVLQRLGCKSIRIGVHWVSPASAEFPQWLADFEKKMADYQKANVVLIVEIGGGGPQVFNRMRSHLDEKGVGPMGYPGDGAWMQSADEDFSGFCKLIVGKFGYPKGPINAIKIWNEPWEGSSISGWASDMLRFREITVAMAKGVEAARSDDKVTVLLGGTDSSSNTLDKFFSDGTDTFLKYLDFCSIHYQGMAPPSTIKAWVNRKSPYGRVKIWDTESWVANTDDRVAAVMAANMSTGHDRAVGVYGGNITSDNWYRDEHRILGDDGKEKQFDTTMVWSVAPAVGAAQHFLGERNFSHLLFAPGLPWVMVFDGLPTGDSRVYEREMMPGAPISKLDNPEDGTVVVVGDLGEEFGPDGMALRTAHGIYEVSHQTEKKKLQDQLAALPVKPSSAEEAKVNADRSRLEKAISAISVLQGATMTIKSGPYSLYDFYGNPVKSKGGKIVVPLDGRGFYLRGDGKRGSFQKLQEAIQTSIIEGIEPLAIQAKDMLNTIDSKPTMRLRLTNVLNRPAKGILTVKLGSLTLDPAQMKLDIPANTVKEVEFKVIAGEATKDNSYPLEARFVENAKSFAVITDIMHVNVIAKKTINVDGNLDDWNGVLPQNIIVNEKAAPSMTEAAWQPYKNFDTSVKQGLSTGYMAYDDNFFYFAAKAADSTPDPGMLRYETRDEDADFYPEVALTAAGSNKSYSARWSGQVQPKVDGEYTFITSSDDGIRLWVDGKQLVNDWNDHGTKENTGSIKLQGGKRYDIKVEYYNGDGGASARLFWASDKLTREIIPADALYPTADAAKSGGLTGDFYFGREPGVKPLVTRVDPTINFEWNEKQVPDEKMKDVKYEELRWPTGERRYTYRRDPELPAGNMPNHDNFQIAFNVIPQAEKSWYINPPGTFPGYITWQTTDYEFALNPVAETYGGGTEIWRLQRPDMPHKHFYPREPKSGKEGAVKEGKLVIKRDETTRMAECAIPWSEMPEVKKAMDEGKTVKFSYRVNDNGWGGCMELAKNRTISRKGTSFTVDWAEHWDNVLEFGFQK